MPHKRNLYDFIFLAHPLSIQGSFDISFVPVGFYRQVLKQRSASSIGDSLIKFQHE